MAVNVAGGLGGRGSLLPTREPKGGSRGLDRVLFLDPSAGYIDVFVHFVKSLNCVFVIRVLFYMHTVL